LVRCDEPCAPSRYEPPAILPAALRARRPHRIQVTIFDGARVEHSYEPLGHGELHDDRHAKVLRADQVIGLRMVRQDRAEVANDRQVDPLRRLDGKLKPLQIVGVVAPWGDSWDLGSGIWPTFRDRTGPWLAASQPPW
jgi:hypothetical protein